MVEISPIIMKVLTVFNICEIRSNKNVEHYVRHIQSLLNQKTNHQQEIAVSGCCATETTKQRLIDRFGKTIRYKWHDRYRSVLRSIRHQKK